MSTFFKKFGYSNHDYNNHHSLTTCEDVKRPIVDKLSTQVYTMYFFKHILYTSIHLLVLVQIINLLPLASSSSSSSSSNHQNYIQPNFDIVNCRERYRNLGPHLSCQCLISNDNSTEINCDQVSFFGPFPSFPNFKETIVSYSQRNAGLQSLDSRSFIADNVKLKKLDLSGNLLRRLKERIFDGIESSLIELNLGHNFLGDQLNPLFSTNEFWSLQSLKYLDLGYNQLQAIDSNTFQGLKNLTVSGSACYANLYSNLVPLISA